YALTKLDSLSVSYNQSRTETVYAPPVPTNGNGVAVSEVRSETSTKTAGVGWIHAQPGERISFCSSVSGGWLGGDENLVRSRAEFERAWHDPFFNQQNTWAFRTSFSAVGSYSGELPFYSRLLAGDEFVRGLPKGGLGPRAVISSISWNSATQYAASPTGADLLAGASEEYRVRLSDSAEGAAFFDMGLGTLLPNWLGRARPTLIDSTNSIVHASTGLQLQWTIPGVGVPVRAYYALNILRLDRWLPMPDGSLFHARDPFGRFGWGLGPMF